MKLWETILVPWSYWLDDVCLGTPIYLPLFHLNHLLVNHYWITYCKQFWTYIYFYEILAVNVSNTNCRLFSYTKIMKMKPVAINYLKRFGFEIFLYVIVIQASFYFRYVGWTVASQFLFKSYIFYFLYLFCWIGIWISRLFLSWENFLKIK